MLCAICGTVISRDSGSRRGRTAFCDDHMYLDDEPTPPSDRKRATFVTTQIATNKTRCSANAIARSCLDLVGLSANRDHVMRMSHRVTAMSLRRISLHTFNVEFGEFLKSLGAKPTNGQLQTIFTMITRSEMPRDLRSTRELSRAIAVFLGTSHSKTIDSLRVDLVALDPRKMTLEEFKAKFGMILQKLKLSATGEDLRTIYGTLKRYRDRKSTRCRRDYHARSDERLWNVAVINDRMRYKGELQLGNRHFVSSADPTRRVEAPSDLLRLYGRDAKHPLEEAHEPKSRPLPTRRGITLPEDLFNEGRGYRPNSSSVV